jgi:ABC-type multidrug transport system fused ATPase/permease subunit
VKPFWRSALATAALTVGVSLVALLQPWPLKILFDSVLGNHPLPRVLEPLLAPFADDRLLLLLVVVAGGFLITLIVNGLSVWSSYAETKLEQGIILDFRSDLFAHAQRLSLAYHDNRRSGNLIFAINYQADSAAGLLMALQPLVQSGLTIVGMFWITYAIDPQLALLSLVVVPFLYYSVSYYMRHIERRLRDVKGMEGESLSIIHEAISMLRVIVAFGRERYEHTRFREHGEKTVDARVGVTVRQTLFSLVVNTTTAAGIALVLGFGVYQILQGRMTAGELLVVFAYVTSIYQPLEAISTTVGSLQERFISLEIAFKLLDTDPDIVDKPDAMPIGRARGGLQFENVSFGYEGRAETLRQIDFIARPGEVVGIVGPTGAGKTTLVSLVPRFYDPDEGRILLDGRDIRDIRLAALRKQTSIVMQEPLLFSGTIAQNIRYGRLDASHEEIVEAAKAANAHDFVMRLPEKYATVLGERGARLSGGERQRISIARAFLRNAPILILDEPTSSIDSRTEAVILDALERLMNGRTTFMIAHRLSTIRSPDSILVLDSGRVVDRGTPEDLIRRRGLYRELWEMQLGPGTGSAAGIPEPARPTGPQSPVTADAVGARGP